MSDRTRLTAFWALVMASVLGLVVACAGGSSTADPVVPPATTEPAVQATPVVPGPDPSLQAEPAPADRWGMDGALEERPPQADPVRLEMPMIDVDTPLEQLGLFPDGTLQTPVDEDLAGWYREGPAPGAVGPAVIAGHVTWGGSESVFFRLGELVPGDIVTVHQEDGSTVDFEVERVEQHPKDDFPTLAVYGNTPWPTLRLVTCGGEFDSSTGSFDDNVIVFARMVA